MIIILFIVLLIIILLYIYIYSKNHFQGNIQGTEVEDNIKFDKTHLYLGQSIENTFLTYDTQFKFKISAKENYYLFNGINCPKQESRDACFKRNSNVVYEALLSKEGEQIEQSKTEFKDAAATTAAATTAAATTGTGDVSSTESSTINDITQTNKDDTNMYWKFFDVERTGNKYIHYGDEVILKNLGKIVSYLCICDTNPLDVDTCGTVYNIYCYDDLKDANEYGKWIIIPKYFRTDYYQQNINKPDVNPFRKYTGGLKDKHGEIIKINSSSDSSSSATSASSSATSASSSATSSTISPKTEIYDFYNDHHIDTLKSKKIPIRISDDFLIINSKTVDGKYIYLNLCNNLVNNPWLQLECYDNKYRKVVGTRGTGDTIKKFADISTTKLEMEIFNWSIEPIIYDVNVHDTLFVYGPLTVGRGGNTVELTSDKLKYIKSIPYYFKDKICLKGHDDKPNCIEKHHIEMLNGSRPINIKSVAPSKPFKLYSSIGYTGREFRIGFDYENANELPYFGGFNSWLNPSDQGKWKSLKIEGPYNAIIYSKPHFGHGEDEQDEGDNYELTQDEANAITEREKIISDIKDAAYDAAIAAGEIPEAELTDTIIEKEKINPLYFIVSPPGISDVTKLGDAWVDGIRSIKFYKPRKDYYELKCLEKYPFTYQPGKDGTSVTEELMTANLCKNGETNQQFYFSGDKDTNYEPDYYKNITENHVHFHRHPYNSSHEGVSLIDEPTPT